jgi:hypothetical protein
MSRLPCWLLGCLAAPLLAGCGHDATPPPVPARSFDDPGFVAAGDYELRYGVVLSADLSAAVAAAYGIEQRDNQVIVNLSVLRHRPGQLPLPVEADVSGSWRDLTHEPAPLQFRTLTAGGAVSYVAAVAVRDRVPFVLELRALPTGGGPVLVAKITRQFDLS